MMGDIGSGAKVDVSKFDVSMDFKYYGEKTIKVPADVINATK